MKIFKKSLSIIIVLFLFSAFKSEQTTWIAIGDSITYLNDHLAETGNRVSKGYVTRVTESFNDLAYINQGHNGWTAGQVADKIDKIGLTKGDIYSVFLGTNDWWAGRPIGNLRDYKLDKGNSTFYGSLRIIINKIRSLNPEANIMLITPMQRGDFVYINNPKNNAYGSYRLKNNQSLEMFANAIDSIGSYEDLPVVDLYHNKSLSVKNMVKYKRLKVPETGLYRNYKYPKSTAIPFNPLTDEYPYPKDAISLTYDGLHPSDKGNALIAKSIVSSFKKFERVRNR